MCIVKGKKKEAIIKQIPLTLQKKKQEQLAVVLF
jgi:hypothetical protein